MTLRRAEPPYLRGASRLGQNGLDIEKETTYDRRLMDTSRVDGVKALHTTGRRDRTPLAPFFGQVLINDLFLQQ